MADSINKSGKSSISTLESGHHELIAGALFNILSTEIAQNTFAQIADGLPLPSVLEDTYCGSDLEPDHPLFAHETLCPGVVEKTKALLEQLDIEILKFDVSVRNLCSPSITTSRQLTRLGQLLDALQTHQPGSSSFNTRFIEIMAVSVHEIAKYFYGLDSRGHQDDGIERWVPPKNKDWEWWWGAHPDGPRPTLFQHRYYFDYEQYPDGAADMVGYWAESRILGGVILFDRKTKPASDAVFIHPDRDSVTYRICELTEDQKASLVNFLLNPMSERVSSTCPLPIIPDLTNTNRIDPEEPISWTGIYRDISERELHPDEVGDGRCRDVWSKGDVYNFLTFEAWQEARGRYVTRRDRYPEDSFL